MALDFVTDHKGSGTMEIKVIVDQLSSYEITPVAEAEKNTYIETHKMIKPGQTSFYPACLYVGYASDLPDALKSAANIIAIEDEPVPPSFSQAPGLNLYLAPCGTSQFDILNRIADIMIDEAAIVAGMRRLIDALYSGAGLQAIVDIASDVMGNPVFVNDGSFKILAMSQSAVFRNISLEEERALGFVTEQNVADMRRDGIVTRRRHDRENTLRVERPESTEQWLFKDVKLHNVWAATVAIVDNNRPFREPFDMEMIERLSKIVAVELEKNELLQGRPQRHERVLSRRSAHRQDAERPRYRGAAPPYRVAVPPVLSSGGRRYAQWSHEPRPSALCHWTASPPFSPIAAGR